MARKIAVELVGDASSLERAFSRSARSAKNFDKSVSGVGTRSRSLGRSFGGLAAGLVGGAGLATAIHSAFQEMSDAQKVSAQTDAVLKSMGDTAGVTADHVDQLATSILNKTGIDDEAIKSGENLLLTFRNIRNEAGKNNDVFDQATKIMTDFSVRFGKDIPSAAVLVGKALNDPVKGLTSLQRVGVQFTKQQRDQIKALVDSGHTLQAQKIIMAELTAETRGAAEAAGATLAGKFNILRETLKNLGGELATTLIPTITKLVDRLNKWLTNSKNQKQVLDTVKAAAAALAGTLRVLTAVFDAVSGAVGGTKNAIYLLIGAVVAFKALQMASTITTLARSFGLLTASTAASGTAMRTTAASSRLLTASFLGKAGLVIGAGVASYEITKLILHLTGLDKKLNALTDKVYDFAAGLGLVQGAPAKFAGRAAIVSLRRQAARLEAGGLTPAQAAARLHRTHPGIPQHDIDVAAGVTGRRPMVVVSGGIHLHGVQNMRQLENELSKRAKQRPSRRRGSR